MIINKEGEYINYNCKDCSRRFTYFYGHLNKNYIDKTFMNMLTLKDSSLELSLNRTLENPFDLDIGSYDEIIVNRENSIERFDWLK